MARFTVQGGLKLLSNVGDRAFLVYDSRDSFHCRLGGSGGDGNGSRRERLLEKPVGIQRSSSSRARLVGWSARVCSPGKKTSSSTGVEDDGAAATVVVDDDYEEEFERDEFSCFRGLVLDIAYRPVNVVCWKRAICLEFMEKADVLEYYDQTVSSSQGSFYIPAVLRVPHLLQAVKRRRIKHSLSRKSIYSRDSYTCQYCTTRENLTIDHVLPISQGGEWKWENLVTACTKCNSKKGYKTLEQANMKLINIPKEPKDYDILAIPLTAAAVKMLKARKCVPEEWLQYLPKPSS